MIWFDELLYDHLHCKAVKYCNELKRNLIRHVTIDQLYLGRPLLFIAHNSTAALPYNILS